ncbi:MAG: hypothetical protein KIT84_31980 [Labilithrix sp.]|nr:hypothetical protein [Labilithrix sp.]MCW5815691.1 hypothetical protein [Labilithrix sp.]
MLRSTFGIAGVFAAFALAACAPEGEAPAAAASNGVSVVPGTSIESPNASPGASYLSSRNIENLRRLGALPGVLTQLARRTDGVLGTSEADGRVSIEELVALEQPGMIEQLVHAERQALPALWRLLEVSREAPSDVTVPAPDTIVATEVSDAATEPLEPATITIASLSTVLHRTAARLQSIHDSDGDKKTIAKADVQAALANPAGFQPWEIQQLEEIEPLFLDRAGTKLGARVHVTDAAPVPTFNYPIVVSFGGASLGLAKGIEYVEKRVKDTTKGDLTVSITGHVIQRVMVTLTTPNQMLILEDGSDREAFVSAGVFETGAGTKTIEIWANGARVGSYRAKLPAITPVDATIDLTRFADYTFVFGPNATPLKRNNRETSTSDGGTKLHATFTHTKDTAWYSVDESIIRECATPPLTVAPGRYALGDDLSLDLYPQGVITLVRADGWAERAIFRGNQWVLPSSSNLRFSYDPKTNQLTIKSAEGAPIFAGPLKGSMRTG